MEFLNKPMPNKEQILKRLREINDDGDIKIGFCQNSRRWQILMFSNPKTCPYEGECNNCDYLKMREPNDYIINQLRLLRWGA